ncbi:MAG TPA: hypothetical protein VH371_04845 [Candidatus Limnocylindrales bacterium]
MLSSRKRAALFGGLVLTLTTVIALAVATTGAYFTDSHGGQISGTNGTVTINANGGAGAGQLDFDFSGILPGQAKTATINIGNPTANSEDVWLVFSNDNGMWSAVNNLGQYGKFIVGGYTYDNLSNKYVPGTPGVAGTPTGGYMSGSCSTVPRVDANYLPHAIKVATLGSGASHSFNVTFQYIECMTDHQGEDIFNAAENDIGGTATITPGPLNFSVVAFQAGVDPTSPFNGVNAIVPLDLSGYGAYNHQYIQP